MIIQVWLSEKTQLVFRSPPHPIKAMRDILAFPEQTWLWNACQKKTFSLTLRWICEIHEKERQQCWVMLGCPHVYSCEMCWLDKGTKAAKCTLTKLQCWQLCPGTIGTSKSSSCGNHGSSILKFALILFLIILILLLSYPTTIYFFNSLAEKKTTFQCCSLKSTSTNIYWCYVCALCWFCALAIKKYCERL